MNDLTPPADQLAARLKRDRVAPDTAVAVIVDAQDRYPYRAVAVRETYPREGRADHVEWRVYALSRRGQVAVTTLGEHRVTVAA